MKISTKGRYALRLMLDLAVHNTGEYIPLKEIAARQEISTKYLEQIIPALSKAGYVQSTRGSQGGYALAQHPSYYTAGMIVRLLEGDMSPVSCIANGDTINCNRAAECVTVDIWQSVKKAVDNILDNVTLEDLTQRYYEKCGSDYCI